MADDKTKTGGQDRTNVNVHEDYEVKYWTEKFDVSSDELKAAVKAAGTSVAAVEAYLQKGK